MLDSMYDWGIVLLLDLVSIVFIYLFFHSLVETQLNFNDNIINRVLKYESSLADSESILVDEGQETLDSFIEEE